MARFHTKRAYDCFGTLLSWNRCRLWLKTNTKVRSVKQFEITPTSLPWHACRFLEISYFHFNSTFIKSCFFLFKSFSQVDGHLDFAESEIYCPFVNHSKIVDQEALSSFLSSPLSVQYANKIQRNGDRIYLDKYHSVTSILKQTRPASEYFALKNWKKAQISELGEGQFKKNKKNTFNRGILFHHVRK